jgi:hypothetical protein
MMRAPARRTHQRRRHEADSVHRSDDRGPFGDHLRYHLFRLHGKDDLIDGLRRIIRENKCADDRIFFRLRGAGLIRAEGLKVVPRCQLYADYLIEHLNGR